jgi:hypothetical protein
VLRCIPRAGACVVLVIAITKLVEIFGGCHFGIDAWFVSNPELFGAVPTGRMAPLTASNFVFIAIALLALTGTKAGKIRWPLRRARHSDWCDRSRGLLVRNTVALRWTHHSRALSTACGFFLSGIRITTAAGPEGWPLRTFLGDSTRAVLLRAFVPLITAAALINGWVNTTLPSWIHVNPAITSALCAVIFAALIAIIILQISNLVGGRIDRAEAARNVAQAELLALNAHLETKVQERTRELRTKNQQMEEELQMARELQIANCTVPSPVTLPYRRRDFSIALVNDVRQFAGRKSFDDDVCVVGMEVQHTG